MVKKGKKKRQNIEEKLESTSEAASTSAVVSTSAAASTSTVTSTSTAASSKQKTSPQQQKQQQEIQKQTSQQQQKSQKQPLQQQSLEKQQQQLPPSVSQEPQRQVPWSPQHQVSKRPRQQQQVPQRTPQQQQASQHPPQLQQVPQGPPQQAAWGPQQQQQVPQGPPQQAAWGPRQQQQVPPGPPQQQQVPPGPPQQQQVPQGPPQQAAWGPRQQQQVPPGPPQQQQVPQGPPQQAAWGPRQQQQVPPGPPQQAAWGPRQQQQVPPGPPQQQQVPQGPLQQAAWGPRQQQQVPPGLPQQQQGPPQQAAWGPRPKQQIPPGPPQQQQVPQGPPQQAAWGPQQQQQVSRGPPQQQQVPQGSSQQQVAWGPRQQQQVPPGPPQQQQGPPQQAAWGPQPKQQIPPGPPQQQQGPPQQAAWGPQPKQQIPPGPPQQQQVPQGPPQQAAWGPQQQQQVPQGPPQQAAWGPRQQQQVSRDPSQQQQIQQGPSQQQIPRGPRQQQQVPAGSVDAGGDRRQTQAPRRSAAYGDMRKEQPTTSIAADLSEFTLGSGLESTKTSTKTKMSSSAMKQYQLSIPKRRNPLKAGTLGTPIRVYTNMFEIIFNKNFVTNAVHYDVNITPIASKSLYRKVLEECRKVHFSNRYPAFDGKKNLYSANDLPFHDSMETEIEIYDSERDRERKFSITLNKVANIDLSWIKNLRPGLDEADRDQTGIQVLDIILRHAPESRFLSVGKSLFWDINDNERLGGGLSLARGGFESAILGWKPYLNVDVAHKGFATSQSVIDLMKEFTGESSPPRYLIPPIQDKVEKYLRGLKVNYQIPNQPRTKRTYRVNGLGPTAREHRFACEGSQITIVDYFRRHKNYNLRYVELPCLWVGAVTKEEKIYLPAELCTVAPSQPINRKLDEEQTTSMIRKAVTDAATRKTKINEAFQQINVNNSDTMRQEFHLSVDTRMKQVDARVLPAPELKYAAKTAVQVRRGTWQLREFKLARNLEPGSWTIYDTTGIRAPCIREFTDSLTTIGKEVGMNIGDPVPFVSVRGPSFRAMKDYFKDKKNLKLIIVVIPERSDAYSSIKQITEIDLGILTQCIKARTVIKNNPSTIKNILLKINSKLNGINHTFNIMPTCLKDNVCMLVGGDVTHPSPDATNIPSIAAVAASSDTSAFQYNITLRLQKAKEEIIVDLERIIVSKLLIYQKINSRLPKKIIYYRDGVSEGQLPQVMHFELAAIKRACKTCKADDIQITCLVVQKRHHVRLFPSHPSESDDRNKNVRAGTIVDTEITHPNHIDFYLVSHASIQGTARPTKYRCICNESNFTEDQIEELTYYLCHIYARCTRAVSYPAPTYYAHLGAYRGRALIQGININLDNLEEEQSKLQMKMAASPMCFV